MTEIEDMNDSFANKLRELQPDASRLDPREAFYQAGYEACRAASRTNHRTHWALGAAVAALALFALIPASYHAGRVAGVNDERQRIVVAQSTDPPKTLPNEATDESVSVAEQTSPGIDVAHAPIAEQATTEDPSQQNRNGWLNPLTEFAKSAMLDRQSESTLSISHAAYFTRQSAMANLSDFPYLVEDSSRTTNEEPITSLSPLVQDMLQPKAAGDFQSFATGLEAVR